MASQPRNRISDNCGIRGMLPYRTCNGDCSYETFSFKRSLPTQAAGEYGGFCKTAFRPYDLAVTAFLVIAKHHSGPDLRVTTDGTQVQWKDAQELCEHCLGYGRRYRIDTARELNLYLN